MLSARARGIPPRHFVPPLRRGELWSATVRTQFPSVGGARGGVVYSLLVIRDSLFVCVSLGRVAPCAYPRICSNCAVACFHILGFPRLVPVGILVVVQTALSLVFTYSDSSRAKRGDPVNKKALRAYRPQTYCPGLPQSYANVSNVSVALRNDRGG